jgi:hypothetical protein
MHDTVERVRRVRLRAGELRRKREDLILGGLGSLCAALALALVGAVGAMTGGGQGGTVPGVYGAMLLRDGAGGYALVGVLSFMAGVVATALGFRYGRKTANQENENKEDDSK